MAASKSNQPRVTVPIMGNAIAMPKADPGRKDDFRPAVENRGPAMPAAPPEVPDAPRVARAMPKAQPPVKGQPKDEAAERDPDAERLQKLEEQQDRLAKALSNAGDRPRVRPQAGRVARGSPE
jgi:hypothetical protein